MLFMLLDELPSCSDHKGVYGVLSRTVIQCNASAAVCGGKAFPWRYQQKRGMIKSFHRYFVYNVAAANFIGTQGLIVKHKIL